LGVTLLFITFWTGCNDFGIGPFSGGTSFTGTAPGNYQIVLDATFKGPSGSTTPVTRSAAVNLSVS
jgi:hypothetical protein